MLRASICHIQDCLLHERKWVWVTTGRKRDGVIRSERQLKKSDCKNKVWVFYSSISCYGAVSVYTVGTAEGRMWKNLYMGT